LLVVGAHGFPASSAAIRSTASGPTLFEGIEQRLGLKLRRTRLALPVVVVDSIERTPEEN
jgi:uncharacterized protein (TIGR03435 family)